MLKCGGVAFSVTFFVRSINVTYMYLYFLLEYCQVDTCFHLTLLCSWCESVWCPLLSQILLIAVFVFIIWWTAMMLIHLVIDQHKDNLVLMLCHINYYSRHFCSLMKSRSFPYTAWSQPGWQKGEYKSTIET